MLNYETICNAVAGNILSEEAVLLEFDNYINYLCTHSYLMEDFSVLYEVDTQMKSQLQAKLVHAILRFRV